MVRDHYQNMTADLEGIYKHNIPFDRSSPKEITHFNAEGYKFDPGVGTVFYSLKPKDIATSNGWKFHISVGANDVPKSWNIVVDEIEKMGSGIKAKVIKPNCIKYFTDPKNKQAGKMITIQQSNNFTNKQHEDLLARIERRFKEENIKPSGIAPKGDRPMTGSNYIHYRNDRIDGKYVSSARTNELDTDSHYNPSKVRDPFLQTNIKEVETRTRADFNKTVKLPLQIAKLSTTPTNGWQIGRKENETFVMRLPVKDMEELKINSILEELTNQGFEPEKCNSEELGAPTIQVSSKQASRLRQVLNTNATQQDSTNKSVTTLTGSLDM